MAILWGYTPSSDRPILHLPATVGSCSIPCCMTYCGFITHSSGFTTLHHLHPFQGLGLMSLLGDFEHHLQISVRDYIPNSWMMFNWDIYQPLHFVQVKSLLAAARMQTLGLARRGALLPRQCRPCREARHRQTAGPNQSWAQEYQDNPRHVHIKHP